MKCDACGNEDKYLKVNYCSACGKKFSDEEREKAYDRTVYGKIDKLLEAKEWITLNKITGNIFVRIAVLLILAVLVVVNVASNGSRLAIRNSEDYSLAYCEQTDEYFVYTEKESFGLSVYLPKKAEACILESYINGALSERLEFSESGSVAVRYAENSYYLLRASYENGDGEEILFYVCPEAAS